MDNPTCLGMLVLIVTTAKWVWDDWGSAAITRWRASRGVDELAQLDAKIAQNATANKVSNSALILLGIALLWVGTSASRETKTQINQIREQITELQARHSNDGESDGD